MPQTLLLSETPLPVYMTIGADDPYRITKDPTRELEFTMEMVHRWQYSVMLSGHMRTPAMLSRSDQ